MWGVRCRAEPMRLCRSCDVLRGGCCVCSAEGKSVFGRKRGRFGVAAVVPCEVSVRHRCDESSEEFRYVGFYPLFGCDRMSGTYPPRRRFGRFMIRRTARGEDANKRGQKQACLHFAGSKY